MQTWRMSAGRSSGAIALHGEIDMAVVGDVERAVSESAPAARDVMLDLSDVSFFDASAIRMILNMRDRVERRGGSFRVQRPSPIVVRVLDACGLGSDFGLDDPQPVPASAPVRRGCVSAARRRVRE
jgi:anti-anti-sigma factor